jgi:hypothetical protein
VYHLRRDNKSMARELFAVTLVGDGELLAALGTTCSEHAAAISGCHTFTETVLVLPSTVVGLKCSFHNAIFFYIVCESGLTGCKSTYFFSFTQDFDDFLLILLRFLFNFHYLCARFREKLRKNQW